MDTYMCNKHKIHLQLGEQRDPRGKIGIVKVLETFYFLNWVSGVWLFILLFSKVCVYVIYTIIGMIRVIIKKYGL